MFPKDYHIAIMEFLLPLTRSKEEYPHITYKELSRRLAERGIIIEPINLGAPLGDVSAFCMDNAAPALSVFVVNSDTLLPGDGIYGFFTAKATLEFEEKYAIFMRERK